MGEQLIAPQRRFSPVDDSADFADRVVRVALLQGRVIDFPVLVTDGTAFLTVDHGLDRAFVGAWVIGQSQGDKNLRIYTPEDTDSRGGDSKTQVGARINSTASVDMFFRLWVF